MISPQTEMIVRMASFFGALILLGIWEHFAPRRAAIVSKSVRWINNLAVVIIDSLLVRLLFPVAVVGVAIFAQHHHMGLLNILAINYWLSVAFSVIVLDLVIYFQHVMFHAVPLFWRFHRMHHVDLDFDVTTGVRFHPIEILLSLLIKFGAIILFGAPVLAVIIFEICLNVVTMFNHSNIRVPLSIDKIIRTLIVTPDMHRIHHSDSPKETNSNFGFNLSLWDRIFATYKNQPQLGHEAMVIGIKSIRDYKYCVRLLGMLWIPFIKDNLEYPINQRDS